MIPFLSPLTRIDVSSPCHLPHVNQSRGTWRLTSLLVSRRTNLDGRLSTMEYRSCLLRWWERGFVRLDSFTFVVRLDDEDVNDNQPSVVPTSAEQTRFSKEREEFRQKYKEQIDQVGLEDLINGVILHLVHLSVTISLATTSKWNSTTRSTQCKRSPTAIRDERHWVSSRLRLHQTIREPRTNTTEWNSRNTSRYGSQCS